MKKKDKHIALEKIITYQFKNREVLHEALRHSSYVNEQPDQNLKDNECLEFLGDAVLNLIVGHLLMQFYPDLKEGSLSRMRASLVNETKLAQIARQLQLGSHLYLGKGERQTNGCNKPSILADAFEALVAAVYLDGGFRSAFQFIKTQFIPILENENLAEQPFDYKSQLQELTQTHQREVPQYRVVQESGPDHDKTFRVQIIAGELKAEGSGKSKKAAEQKAAKLVLAMFHGSDRASRS